MRPTTRHITVDGEAAPPLPVITFAAHQPGPTVVVTANMHGDETTGLFASHALIERLTPDGPGRGTLVILPSLNPEGLQNGSRVVPTDGNDLNRAFPGRRRGRAAERVAERVWRELGQLKPDVVIDLHADSALSIPYALLDRPVTLTNAAAKAIRERLWTLGTATGLTVVNEYPADLYVRYNLNHSLAGALVNKRQCAAVTIEAGARRFADPTAVTAMVDAVLGVLTHLNMDVPAPTPTHTAVEGGPWRRQAGPRTQVAGWLDPIIAPGQTFRRGELLARVRNVDGRILEALQAQRSGLVLSWVESTWVTAGSVVGTLAVKEGNA